jgi:glycosyltransferase involved in cell wall biosynthesis
MTRRVLSLSTLYPNAATPRFGPFVARSLEALAARGDWDVTLVNPIGVPPIRFGKYGALARAAVDGIEHGVSVHRPLFPLVPRLSARWNAGSIARAVLPLARRLHAETPFDLVDAQFFFPDGPAAAAMARGLGLPLSIKARGADIQYWGHKPWARAQILRAGEQAAGLLAVSQALVDDMAALGLPRDKIVLHYTGLDHARFHPRERQAMRRLVANRHGISLQPREHLLVTVGALIPRKGQVLVIEALRRLPGAVLALVGDGPDRASLAAAASEAGVDERVHFLGVLDHQHLPELLSAADAMVLPAASEGLANAWIEALACGTPVVIAEAGGAREVMQTPSAGRIAPRDADAIAAAVEDLLDSPPLPEAVAANAARFSWEANAAALAEYYERLLASG